jgi:hypothetical protein
MLNRSAIIVRPNQPFLDWAATLDGSDLEPDQEGDQTVYLIPEYEDDFEAAVVLSQIYDIIFEEELFAWHTDESEWPKNRSYSMFREWFNIEFHSIVEDICSYEIEDDESDV